MSRTFTEPIVPAFQVGDCPVLPEGFYGSGEVIPLGHATETIDFGAGCGGSCDLRTINLAGGSIFIEETFSDGSCPGVCGSRGLGQPNSGTLTDTIMCGTGIFTGATGSLTGTSRPQGLRVTSSSRRHISRRRTPKPGVDRFESCRPCLAVGSRARFTGHDDFRGLHALKSDVRAPRPPMSAAAADAPGRDLALVILTRFLITSPA